ncbi:hypothetical protein PYW08_012625 [Mythimna loreyi]|uniref:Uncharacterized protein n=1 Tax=Mythimna loreyi TaxID=667449 RepID=A0ACC2Q2K4_9NEOP|nr:hypothetical protein PYW08_012625 [Mythimna loreyi]
MSQHSTVTTRSKLRRLEEAMTKRRGLESDSGVPTEMAPGSPSVAPSATPAPAPVIPLVGHGRVIDHSDTVAPRASDSRRSVRASSRASHTSSRSAQRSVDYLRRRAEYEAEKELVKLRENLVRKKLEADLAEIDAVADEEDSSDGEEATQRVEEWMTHADPSMQRIVTTCATATVTSHAFPAPTPSIARETTAPASVFPRIVTTCAPATPRDVTVSETAPHPVSALIHQCAPATVQFRDRTTEAPAPSGDAPRVERGRAEWERPVTEDAERSRSRDRDRRLDQLAEAITSIARPRPVPKQAYELPYFSGDPADWISYKHMYWETTSMYGFKPHENIARLKTSLQGEAKAAVEDLLRTSTNPAEVMKALDEEFGHPNMVLECALRKVRALPRVTESGRELRKFSSTVRNCVSLLRNVHATGYLNNPQLVSELLFKLTPVQRAQYGDFAMGVASSQGIDVRVSPSLEILSEFLSHLARATSFYVQMEAGAPLAPVIRQQQKSAPKQTPRNVNVQRLHVQSESQPQQAHEYQCTLCKERHNLTKCDKFAKLSVDDRWQHVKDNRLCFKCIVKRHPKNVCRGNKCPTCSYNHHALLHYEKGATESVTNVSEYHGKSLLKVLPVCVTIGGVSHETYALLDDGATVSLVDASLTGKLRGRTEPLVLKSARGQELSDHHSQRVTVSVRGPNGNIHNVKCRTFDRLDLPSQTVPAALLAEHAHLRDLDCGEMVGAKPRLLLGQDNWELLVGREMRRGKSGKPVASLTELGWVVHGPVGRGHRPVEDSVNCVVDSNVELHELVKCQFELEAIGISEVPRSSADNDRALGILEKTSRLSSNGQWEVGLLWKQDNPQLPDNYTCARHRLTGIVRKLSRDREYALAYQAQVSRLVNEGYASEVEGSVSDPVWYLPHFGVSNPNKPGKLRLVFDAAATFQGTSLNDNLLAGPDLLNSLLGVLFKFRLGPIGFTGDIADMFMRVKIREQDRGAQLFLWQSAADSEPRTYAMSSMIFGAVSSPTSAIFILNKNASRFLDEYPEAVAAIHAKHYMDDYLDSTWSVEQACKLVADVTHIHAEGGFHIRGWVTNSEELRARLKLDMPDRVAMESGDNDTERTLGLMWSPATDQFAFDTSFKKIPRAIVDGEVVPTKREFLRVVMSVFDPLGFLCPCVIQSRILMQRIWRTGIQWDEQLREEEARSWFEWLHNLRAVDRVAIPRWYGLNLDDLELHVFGDASESAYAAVAYIAGYNELGERQASFVLGKARVAPQKVISIPRLELQAAVLACRVASTVERELGVEIKCRYFWTDSQTVLKWINSDAADFQRFVSHRLAEIDSRSMKADWHWVPSALNPADKATRLDWPSSCDEWLSGPAFLRSPQEQWPVDSGSSAVTEESLERVMRVNVLGARTEPVLTPERLPTWTRAVRVIALLLIFTDRCRRRRVSAAVTAEDLREAELRLLRSTQAESYAEEVAALREGRALPKNSKLRALDPMLFEDGLLRVRGRLGACKELVFGARHPIILDGKHPLTRKLVHKYHVASLHANQETVVNNIRERYWITNLRSTVKTVAAQCQVCRIHRSKPTTPKMGDLPPARLEVTRRAFVHCGVDYFGPMEVAVGRRREKRWGVLFTCLTTRAVHLELAASLSADSAILALRRLIARRGCPADIYSDRGTNFVGAHSELRAALREIDHDRLESEATGRGIAWHFNPPAAPHMGGCWERLVRSVKNALRATLKERAPREEVLYTLLAEAELVINSRPLAYVSCDTERPVVLTPNHLLLGSAAGDAPCTRRHAADVDSRRMWRRVNALADLFWRRWLREYLPTLQRRGKWCGDVPNISVNDVVVLIDESKPRSQWTKGVVTNVHPGSDSVVRVVDVRTNTGILRRPVVKVVVLPTDGSVIG